ncbi:uncharacterized protein LOC123705064 [Colias croceus]|uniref:uncharacterized protein LOC123705064 n=1 Tax=Colias crocea TaxID=72248 RepID=UPI001E2818E7|nr:uncharacterized protein LOC123705064 [Colias croceus]
MGNQHSTSHAGLKPKKNVHWKSAGRPAVPGKPDVIPIPSAEEPNAITLRWPPSVHDGGAPLRGYQVECNRLGSTEWVRTSPPIVLRPELVLSGLEPPHRYQFRVAALNAVGRSDYSELSDVLTVSSDRIQNEPPLFLQHLDDVIALENDKTEFRVSFSGIPIPTIAWFKDDYEIFSSRRTAISTTESTSVLIFHQTLPSDEGEIKCTATNRLGHAITKSHLTLEAAPKLRYPRQYEDGLLYEVNETVYLKTTIVGKPIPSIEWRHDGQPIVPDSRVEITNTPKFSMLKIHSAKRTDRGEYQVHAKNNIGEDTAAFLVTITAPPDPPQRVTVTRQVDKSVTLDWEPPEDDGGCRIGNYIVEYYRTGWNVWLKATTSRKTNVTLFDLIEGSEYRFRVKAESPYGMSVPSTESAPIRIPGKPVDMEFLAVESKIINEVLTRENGEEPPVSPTPRRKRAYARSTSPLSTSTPKTEGNTQAGASPVPRRRPRDASESNEFMLVLYPNTDKSAEKAEKRKSFQLDLEDALSPPPISLSAPELSSRCVMPFKSLRNAVSSTELLHEQAMARFYKAVAMKEEQNKQKDSKIKDINTTTPDLNNSYAYEPPTKPSKEVNLKKPEIFIKTDSIENRHYKYSSEERQNSEEIDGKWQQMSFDEDYTASTVSTGEEYSDEDAESLIEDVDRQSQYSNDEVTYNPRDKIAHQLPNEQTEDTSEIVEENIEKEYVKPLPIPDPNFVPKPILKRREADNVNQLEKTMTKVENKVLKNNKKEEKMTLLKKITKMPVQKPFGFPKILNKKEPVKNKDKEKKDEAIPKEQPKKTEKVDDKLDDGGRTVIDYYGNIVKEYGSHKRLQTPIYLNTEDLKLEAEKQQKGHDNEENDAIKSKSVNENRLENKTIRDKIKKKRIAQKPTQNVKTLPDKSVKNVLLHSTKTKQQNFVSLQNYEDNENLKNIENAKVVLKKTERATIVIPIDYQKLEQKAKKNVRSAIDYTVDICLLLLAFWLYFFKDERLAIPFLILIIYRQLQETIFLNIPRLISRYCPNWLKKKTS